MRGDPNDRVGMEDRLTAIFCDDTQSNHTTDGINVLGTTDLDGQGSASSKEKYLSL